ncbi:restriction endonuclease subunit S [Bacteroides ovatus]|uniref:restriction endonuclease subunit S n=1 Tax=Bacteroides ovatus TaxID=28116 RepID=UPI00189B1247|nr:restriction endonuclease subunit S [Bacteroides ovatus]MDC2645856.1 restriction endonuclease subunit S [Bacteroides ovatus]
MSSYYEKILATGDVKCIDDEIPFEIPQGWEWCRLNDLALYRKGPFGSSLTKSMFVAKSNQSIKVYEQKNAIQKDFTLGDYYISKEKFETMQGFIAKPNDIIVSCAGTIGETYLLPSDAPVGIINQALMRVTLFDLSMVEYWQVYFAYMLLNESQMKGAGSAIKNIPPFEYLKAVLVPIPPLAEQERLIEKYKTLLSLVDKYEIESCKLNNLNRNVSEKLKKSILQEAIQGKLVPQIKEEGTAKELLEEIKAEKQKLVKEGKLKKSALNDSVIFRGDDNKYWEKKGNNIVCIDDEIPFEIPNSWNWCRLKDIGKTETGTTPSKLHPEYFGNYIPFLSPANILGSKIISETQGLSNIGVEYGRIVPKNSILQVCIGGSIGKCAIVNKPVTFNQQINSITPYLCNVEFVHIVLQSEYFRLAIIDKATGTATPIINRGNWETLLFPLPPLKEQQRIIEKYKGVTSIMS